MSNAKDISRTRKRKRPHEKTWLQEFILGGTSTSIACLISNPFDVLKVRMQLQGELKSKGSYQVHYRNIFTAAWTIIRVEGIFALQKGLGPAILYQFCMNGVRLGTFQTIVNMGQKVDREREEEARRRGSVTPRSMDGPRNASDSLPASSSPSNNLARSVVAGALGGALGGMVASPLYLVKTQLQSRALRAIAVGHQHEHTSTFQALRKIYGEQGLRGLWRGVEGAVPRLTLGSALQLSTFSYMKEAVRRSGHVEEPWVPVVASLLSSVNIIIFMEPLDVVRTRLYNQPTDARGRGLYYRGFWDCFRKVIQTEGFLHGMYKGAGAAYFRMAPQAIMGLSFWDSIRRAWYGTGAGDEGEDGGGE